VTWAVDLPDPHKYGGEDDAWINLDYFDSEAQAIAFVREHLGADEQGKLNLISFVPDEENQEEAVPALQNYRPDNLLGNVIDVIADRTGLVPEHIAHKIADCYGDGDFGVAEDRLWDRFGRVIDGIQDELKLLGEEDAPHVSRIPPPGLLREVKLPQSIFNMEKDK
jgi:hypothetical protein